MLAIAVYNQLISPKPITYNKFVESLGGVSGCKQWDVQVGNGPLDIEETAKTTYNELMKPGPGQNPADVKVKNFGANAVMRDTVERDD